MGGDGGVIATKRAYFVKVKKAKEKRDPAEVAAQRWRTCALTNQPLRPPIVADYLGLLYNKDSVIAQLLSKKKFPKQLRHIKSLKSLINVQFTPNPALKASGATAESSAVSDSGNYWTGSSRGEFVCPVSLQETNGKHPFIVLSTCGHALSAKAMQEVPSQKCLVCSKPFTPLDVVPLCPTSDKQLGVQRGRMRERKAAKKAAKHSTKAGESSVTATEAADGAGGGAGSGGCGSETRATASNDAHGGAGVGTEGVKPSASSRKRKNRKRSAPGSTVAANPAVTAKPRISAASASIVAQAEAAIKAQREKSGVYTQMFTSSRKDADGETHNKNLFIRTATNIYGMSMAYD